jgi:hypothetical protein
MLNYGPYVEATASAIEVLERTSVVKIGVFDFRLLRIPALYVAAAWLVGTQRLVMPLAPSPNFLEAGSLLPEERFIGLVRQQAQRLRELEGPADV